MRQQLDRSRTAQHFDTSNGSGADQRESLMANAAMSPMNVPSGGLASFLTSNMDEIDDSVLAFGRGDGINSMRDVAERMAQMGRNGDNYVVHASEREMIVPREVVERNPALRQAIMRGIEAEGADPNAYVVGSDANSINPMTGQREFFLKGLVKGVKNLFKKIAPVVLPFALNALFPGLGTIASGALGAGIGTLVQGGNFKDALRNAFIGGAAGGLMSGIQGAVSGEGFMAGVRSGLPSFGGQSPQVATTASSRAPSAVQGELGGTAGELVAPRPAPTTALPETPGFFESIRSGNIGEAFFPGRTTAADVLASRGIDPLAATPTQLSAAKMVAEQAAPSLIRQYAPIAAAGTLAMGALGGFETPSVSGPGAFRGPTAEEIEARRMGLSAPTTFVTAADVMASPTDVYRPYQAPVQMAANGGEMMSFPRRSGFISGPGTETSDDVPAMLSDGEFVMTARAVRGAGDGDRQHGVRKMYDLMRAFEGGAV
jgi:hypothetical protein